jgi:hypothetical protein
VTKLRAAAQEDQRRSQMNLLVCYQGGAGSSGGMHAIAWLLLTHTVLRPLEVSSRIRGVDPKARVPLARCPLYYWGSVGLILALWTVQVHLLRLRQLCNHICLLDTDLIEQLADVEIDDVVR